MAMVSGFERDASGQLLVGSGGVVVRNGFLRTADGALAVSGLDAGSGGTVDQVARDAAAAKYTKPGSGIPVADLAFDPATQVELDAVAAVAAGKVDSADARLSNARTPTAHKASHATGGSDALTAGDVGAVAASTLGAASGTAQLDAGGRLVPAQAPVTPINAQTGSYTPVLSDHGRAIEVTSASAAVVTIPANSAVAFPVGATFEVFVGGTGGVTFAPASGVVLRERENKLRAGGQYSTVAFRKRASDEWVVSGDVIA